MLNQMLTESGSSKVVFLPPCCIHPTAAVCACPYSALISEGLSYPASDYLSLSHLQDRRDQQSQPDGVEKLAEGDNSSRNRGEL